MASSTRISLEVSDDDQVSLNWWRLGPWLAQRGYTVRAPVCRGHGKSPRTETYTYEDFCSDLPAGPFDLVIGHSLGTMLAIMKAHTEGEHFAKQLILIEPFRIAGRDVPAVKQEMLNELIDTRETILQAHPRWCEEDITAKLECAHQASPEMVIKVFAKEEPLDKTSELKELKVKTLIIAGSDGMWTSDLAEEVKVNSLVTTRFVQDTGHSPHRDDWPAFIRIVEEVLQ